MASKINIEELEEHTKGITVVRYGNRYSLNDILGTLNELTELNTIVDLNETISKDQKYSTTYEALSLILNGPGKQDINQVDFAKLFSFKSEIDTLLHNDKIDNNISTQPQDYND